MVDLHTQITDQTADNLDAAARSMVSRMREPQMQTICAQYMGQIKLPENARVLEIGCGNGAATDLILKHIDPAILVGIDPAPKLICMAKTTFADESRASFAVGTAVKTGQVDAIFDLVIAHTVYSHLEDPQSALVEAHRVLKHGGQLVIFDGDYAETIERFDGGPFAANVASAFSDMIHAPCIMRRLPDLAVKAGFIVEDIRPYRYVHTTSAELLLTWLSRSVNATARAATRNEALVRRLSSEIQKRATNGTLSSVIQFLSLFARKPISSSESP